MIRLANELAHNIYTFAGLALGSIGGIIVALINSRSKENKQINALKKELEEAHSKAEGLQKAFSIVFDAYEREFKNDPSKMGLLKDLKKEYDL